MVERESWNEIRYRKVIDVSRRKKKVVGPAHASGGGVWVHRNSFREEPYLVRVLKD